MPSCHTLIFLSYGVGNHMERKHNFPNKHESKMIASTPITLKYTWKDFESKFKVKTVDIGRSFKIPI